MGNTTLIRILSCDSVIAGAFFPQSELDVPEEEVGQDAGHHVMNPPWKFPDLIVVHSDFGLCFFKTLLDGPSHTTEPNQQLESTARGGITDKIRIDWLIAQGSADQ